MYVKMERIFGDWSILQSQPIATSASTCWQAWAEKALAAHVSLCSGYLTKKY